MRLTDLHRRPFRTSLIMSGIFIALLWLVWPELELQVRSLMGLTFELLLLVNLIMVADPSDRPNWMTRGGQWISRSLNRWQTWYEKNAGQINPTASKDSWVKH
jgi:hypothetical protein